MGRHAAPKPGFSSIFERYGMAEASDNTSESSGPAGPQPRPTDADTATGIDLGGGLVLPMDRIALTASRATGPGGQNVNRRATRISLRVAMADLEALIGTEAAHRLRRLAGWRITESDELLLHCDEHRTQGANRRAGIQRLVELVRQARTRPKRRIPTRTPRSVKRQRLEGKRKRATIKQQRRRPRGDEQR